MLYWLIACVLGIVFEITAYASFYLSQKWSYLRTVVLSCASGLLIISISFSYKISVGIFSVTLFFALYRLLNIIRAIRHRWHPKRMFQISLFSILWLTIMQLAATVIVLLISNLVPDNESRINVYLLVVAWTTTFLLLTTLRTWDKTRPPRDLKPIIDRELPTLSVLVPARNETVELRRCLERLVASNYPKLEIIALDDSSHDKRTPEIIRSFAHRGVRFIKGDQPPARMLAKNHAYQRLADESSGEILCFLGADVMVEPDSLKQLVQTLLGKNRAMLSLLPLRPADERRRYSFVQAMRYWWELGFPRRQFNRPPVLSTLWMIRREQFKQSGGMKAAAQMITPEAHFAKLAISNDKYMFMRSTPRLPITSTKSITEQYHTAIRVRYPQLHKRIALVSLTTLFTVFVLIGPFLALPALLLLNPHWISLLLSLVSIGCLTVMYYVIGIRTHLNNFWLGLLTAPIAFCIDIFVMHSSMLSYEFGHVTWRDRSLNHTMLDVIPKLPEIDSNTSKT